MELTERFIKVIEKGLRDGEVIDHRLKSFVEKIIDRWAFVVTPFVLDNPSDKFQKVVHFYQKGLALEKSGRLVAAKMFPFENPDIFRQYGTEASKKEIASTVNDVKWNPFDSKMSLSPKKWEDIQNSKETIESSFKLLDQMLWSSFKKLDDIRNIETVEGFENFVFNKEEDIDDLTIQINKIRRYIYSNNVNGKSVKELEETRGTDTYIPRGDMHRTLKKTLINEYSDFIKNKSFEAMKEFSESFDKSMSSVIERDDSSVILYNKFMGFKGNEKNKENGQLLKMINEKFPWALKFTGEFDTEMSEKLGKEINDMKNNNEGQDDIDKHIHERLVKTIQKNHQISERSIELIEACFDKNRFMGLGSLRKLTEEFSENKEAKMLFSNVAESLFREIIVMAIRHKNGNDDSDIMNMARIKIFSMMKEQKDIVKSLGTDFEIKLPEKLDEIDEFYNNSFLNKEFFNVVSKDRVTLYAHDILQNVLSTNMNNSTPLASKDVLNLIYKNGVKISDMIKTIFRTEIIRGKTFDTDIDNMKSVADVPLPHVAGLNKRYSIMHNDKFYHIDFPSTLNEIKNMMSWNTMEDGFDGSAKSNHVTGEMKALYGVLGQRIISQATSYMVSDDNKVKKPFIIRSDTDVSSCVPLAYGEIDVMSLTKKIPEKLFSMVMVDDMNSNKEEIAGVLARIKTLNIHSVSYDDVIRERKRNLDEIIRNKGNEPLIKPLADENVLTWLKKRRVFGNNSSNDVLINEANRIKNEITGVKHEKNNFDREY